MVARVTHRLLIAALLLLSGCAGLVTWLPIYTSRSPDGKRDVSVEVRKCLADCAVRVVLHDRWWTSTQFGSGEDCNIAFAHTVWTGSKVGVYVDGRICAPIKVANDFDAKRDVPFSEIEEDMRRSIIADYGATQKELEEVGGDVFHWASNRGEDPVRRSIVLFRERYAKKR